MKTKSLFITATDTDVGKTIVTYLLARTLKSEGFKTSIIKPMSSGLIKSKQTGELVAPDIEFLKTGLNDWKEEDIISPVCFKAPLAPYVASQLENRSVDLRKIYRAFEALKKRSERVVVEGIGGMMVPLTRRVCVGDMIKKMNIPVLIVTRPNLGTLNHTLLTIHYARSLGLKIAGIIINYSNKATRSIAEKTSPQCLQEIAGIPILATIPYMPSLGNSVSFKSLDRLYKKCDFHSVLKKCF